MQIHLSLCLFLHESIFQYINLLICPSICHISIFYLHFFPSIFYSSNIYTYFIYNLIHFVIHSSINTLIYLSIYLYNFHKFHPILIPSQSTVPSSCLISRPAREGIISQPIGQRPPPAGWSTQLWLRIGAAAVGAAAAAAVVECVPLFVYVCVCSVFLENKIAFS